MDADAENRTDAKQAARVRRPIFPPAYLLGSLVAMLALHHFVPGPVMIRSPWTYLGDLSIAAGIFVIFRCAWEFRRRATTIKPFQESSALVTDGLYRFSRNPIYLAMVLVLAGMAIGLGSLSPWVVLPIFVGLIQVRFIRAEESMLAARFGEEFEQYRQRTRRWI